MTEPGEKIKRGSQICFHPDPLAPTPHRSHEEAAAVF